MATKNIEFDIPLPHLDTVVESSEFELDGERVFNLHNLTSLHDDGFEKDLRTAQSLSVGNYEISNFYPGDCGQTDAREIQLSQPNVNFIGGKGWIGSKGCLVDTDTDLRFEKNTNKRYINQLQERLVKTTPFIRGILDVDVETKLISGNKTDTKKTIGDYTNAADDPEQLFNRQLTPLIDKLKNEIQDPNRIIQENVDHEWIQGGVPTRQIMRNIDYLKRCNNQ